MSKDIVVVVDYHDRTSQFRIFNEVSGREGCEEHETEAGVFEAVVTEAGAQARAQGGRVVWVMESTNGWARMKKLLGRRAELVLANVVQMPLPPKAKRRKTDKLDTGRVLREYRNGTLPRSYQPAASVRRLRRLVGLEQSLVRRRTALRNWVNRYLSHETVRCDPQTAATLGSAHDAVAIDLKRNTAPPHMRRKEASAPYPEHQ